MNAKVNPDQKKKCRLHEENEPGVTVYSTELHYEPNLSKFAFLMFCL